MLEKTEGTQTVPAAKANTVPIWHKYALTIDEAAVFFHIGESKLRSIISNNPSADYLLRNGSKVLIKRERFSAILDKITSI